MPIRALCTICSDFFDHTRDVAAIHCGHTFHLQCLFQWFESAPSRTCPQCRIQVGKRAIINKLFFNVAQEEETVLDAEFLKNELDNTRAQLAQKEKEKKDNQAIIDALRDTLEERNATVESLQKALDKSEMLCSALKKQMKFLEQHQDETKQAREEARQLRNKMKTMERIELLLQSQRPEVEKMIQDMGVGQSATEQLAVYCVSLKKEYENLKESRKTSRELTDKLKKDLFSSKSKLQTVNCELNQVRLELKSAQKDLQSADKEITSLKKKLTVLQETLNLSPVDRESVNRLVLESPVPLGMLKLRQPIFSDEIDLNATFDIETPPARSSDNHFGLAKKLCLEKASSSVENVSKKISSDPLQESPLAQDNQCCQEEPDEDEELANAFPLYIRNVVLARKKPSKDRSEPSRSTDRIRTGFDGLGGRTRFTQTGDIRFIRSRPPLIRPKAKAKSRGKAKTMLPPSQAKLDMYL